MRLNGKEILTLSALLAERLTKDLDEHDLINLKLFMNQLNNDINTLYSVKLLEKAQKAPKTK